MREVDLNPGRLPSPTSWVQPQELGTTVGARRTLSLGQVQVGHLDSSPSQSPRAGALELDTPGCMFHL